MEIYVNTELPSDNRLRPLVVADTKYCVRRLPMSVRDLLVESEGTLMLAGGFIRSCVAGESINDIDLLTSSKDKAAAMVLSLSKKCNYTGQPYTTDNAYSIKAEGMFTQFVHRWTFNEPAELLHSFDFTIAKAALWYKDKRWHGLCDHRFYQDLAAKRLVYTSPARNEDAGGSMLRVLKFYQRGYRIPLDSLGAVIARLMSGVNMAVLPAEDTPEQGLARVLTGLLVEVDPNSIQMGTAYYTDDNT